MKKSVDNSKIMWYIITVLRDEYELMEVKTMFKGRDDWFEIWFEDKRSMLDTMVKNMQSDLNAGYDYFGQSIKSQRAQIDSYKRLFDQELDMFADMDEKQVNRWCYYDMLKRGVIEL